MAAKKMIISVLPMASNGLFRKSYLLNMRLIDITLAGLFICLTMNVNMSKYRKEVNMTSIKQFK